jgi:hypothetical protein
MEFERIAPVIPGIELQSPHPLCSRRPKGEKKGLDPPIRGRQKEPEKEKTFL